MKFTLVIAVGAVVLALRIFLRGRGRSGHAPSPDDARPHRRVALGDSLGDVGLVALREIRERVRGRIFRVGTVIILLVVAAAIVIPVIHGGQAGPQEVGVVGPTDPSLEQLVQQAGARVGTAVRIVPEPSARAADDAVRSGAIDVAVVDGDRVVVNAPVSADSTSTVATVAQEVAVELGIEHAYREAGLSGSQVAQLAHARPVPVQSLQPSTKGTARTTSVIGLILVFLMLTQYNTWILMGVMQEKASRVVEVLLATVRPIQLLGGKVLGIGLVAMGQAAVIVVFALVLAEAVGSDLLHGTAPLVLASELVWLFLGYAFYCWVYAAAGSMAERQDQVQTLALPLSLPIIVGYVLALTTASTGNADLLFKVLAYLPPTAPFAMPVLVGLGDVAWWQFLASVLISIAGTVAMALVAAGVYRRAVLRSGQQVRLRELFSRPAGKRRGTAGVPG
jgi:ABC-2 type transport system permease protein